MPADSRPNVVFIICHDLGRQVSPYGRDVKTPAAEEMADNGVTFDNAMCVQPNCAPSRASIQTGLYPHQHGIMGLAPLGWELNEGVSPLPALMNQAGYDTYLFGFQHTVELDHPEWLGYETVHNDPEEQITEEAHALDVAERFHDALGDLDREQPFYASLG